MVVQVGYVRYACLPADAITLLDVSMRMVAVDRRYPAPFRPIADAPPMVTSAEIAEFDDGSAPATTDDPAEPPPVADESPF
jgi:hypothetical protein